MHTNIYYIFGFNNTSGQYNTVNFIRHLMFASEKTIQKDYKIPTSQRTYQDMVLPETFTASKHYLLLYYIAKMVKVKVMWKDQLPMQDMVTKKGILVIGEETRVDNFIRIISNLYEQFASHKDYLKHNRKEITKWQNLVDFRVYSSKQIQLSIDTLVTYIKAKLEDDIKYEQVLENWIKEQFRLDYKRYRANRVEYHYAISKKYHNRRMLL